MAISTSSPTSTGGSEPPASSLPPPACHLWEQRKLRLPLASCGSAPGHDAGDAALPPCALRFVRSLSPAGVFLWRRGRTAWVVPVGGGGRRGVCGSAGAARLPARGPPFPTPSRPAGRGHRAARALRTRGGPPTSTGGGLGGGAHGLAARMLAVCLLSGGRAGRSPVRASWAGGRPCPQIHPPPSVPGHKSTRDRQSPGTSLATKYSRMSWRTARRSAQRARRERRRPGSM
jgi:hypothetical protein